MGGYRETSSLKNRNMQREIKRNGKKIEEKKKSKRQRNCYTITSFETYIACFIENSPQSM